MTLLVSSAHAPMIQMQLPQIIEKVNATYGYAAISRISPKIDSIDSAWCDSVSDIATASPAC